MVSTRLSDEVGRVVNGRYRLVAPLGAGSSAQVFLADDVNLGRQVAVKMLQPGLAEDDRFLRRFRTEAQTVAAINHPNVVVVHDWGEDDVPYLVTEYLAGGSLRAILHAAAAGEGELLSPSQALVVGLDVCRGLAHAHNAGLVHRDLKPANLLFDTEGRLRIADFGLARAIAEASVTEPEGAVMGTARYAAPEQARGERLDGKADVYALAVLLVEAVTGVAPFASDTTLGTLMARVDKDLVVPAELGPLRPALERAGRLHAEDRPDAEELGILLLAASERMPAPDPLPLVGALAEADQVVGTPNEADQTMTLLPLAGDATVVDEAPATSSGSGSGSDVSGGDDPAPARSRRWPWALAAVLLVALGAGGFFLAQQLQTPTHEIPDLAGRQIDDIELIAEDNEWVLDEKKTRRDDTEPGEIVSTEPGAGERLAEGGTLVVVVSEGNTLTDVPTDVADRPLDDVRVDFEAAGLEISTTDVFDEDIVAGNVIGVDGEVAVSLPKGESVPLLVSKGPEPRVVPEVPDGATFDDVKKLLDEVQLVAKKAEEFSDDVDKGVVISLSEESGSELARGATVTVVVSKGPDVVDVPQMKGMSLAEAEDALEKAGLVLGEFVGGGAKSEVVASDPEAGTSVPRGSKVNLLLKK
ncbi:protein kinase domain-containing protein [Actinospongicola halichondriae]|uniref:Stk1 family PASTA domain-containing Ser/Thr kinase n=1 Tax=Actinospongicola halichondriae TaxID=3236844 RepID=UPI003D3B771D